LTKEGKGAGEERARNIEETLTALSKEAEAEYPGSRTGDAPLEKR
jgi:hypothetical protein